MKKPQLFLLHFAGGNCHSFNFLQPFLQDFEVFPLELPGRGKRIKEDLLADFNIAAEDIFNQVLTRLNGNPFLIYGHSMGAKLTLRVGNLLELAGRMPVALIVSGNAGPGINEDKETYLLGYNDFILALERLGGIPAEVIRDQELMAFFEPVLRVDFRLAENNNMKNEQPVKAPIFALMGSEEENADHISNWARFTHSNFEHDILNGDHFFIHKYPARIAKIIRQCYAKHIMLQRKAIMKNN